MTTATKTPGQIAYEQDVHRRPNYEDGGSRPTWEQLGEIHNANAAAVIRESWERNPTARTLSTDLLGRLLPLVDAKAQGVIMEELDNRKYDEPQAIKLGAADPRNDRPGTDEDTEEEEEQPRMKCDRCQALMIQGVFCHETGCPNTRSRYDEETGNWVKQYECGECGSMVDTGESCCDGLDDEPEPVDAEERYTHED